FTNGASSITQDDYVISWLCKEISQKSNNWSGNNYERVCNKDYDAAYDSFTKELDDSKRNDLLIKMNDILVQDVVIIPLVALNQAIPPAVRENIRQSLGLDQPWYIRYVKWLIAAMQADFGYSFNSKVPVTDLIMLKLPNTLAVLGVAYVLSVFLAIPIGALS